MLSGHAQSLSRVMHIFHLVPKFKTILSPGIGKFCFSRFDTPAPSVDMTKGRVCGACLGSLASAMVFLQLQGQEGQTGFQ